MQIALLGGTGDVGQGLALRWAYHTDHDVLVGSREAGRARGKAAEYETELDSRGVSRSVEGLANPAAAARADVVVLAVPAYHVADTVTAVGDGLDDGTILVSPAVGTTRDEAGSHYHRPGAGSVAAVAAGAAPDGVPVVATFHTLSADRLANIDVELDQDTPVVGDDADARETVASLAEGIEGLHAVDAGPLANAAEVESLAPLLSNVERYEENRHDVGVRFC